MELVFATHNPNKLKELQAILPGFISVKNLTDIDCTEEIIEDADTIEGNALLKARYVHKNYNFSCFADDTGLEVEALDGAPGVYSARYAGAQKNAEDNMQKLLAALQNEENRKARFKTVIALIINGKEYIFTGICRGTIAKSKQGTSGFGYDPIFQPEGHKQTFAEMPLSLKNKISHRGKAVQELVAFLEKYNNHKI